MVVWSFAQVFHEPVPSGELAHRDDPWRALVGTLPPALTMLRVPQEPFQFIVLAGGLFTFPTSLPGYAHGGLWERLAIQALKEAVNADSKRLQINHDTIIVFIRSLRVSKAC